MMHAKNLERASWAAPALVQFAKTTGMDLKAETDDAIADLICDLLHLAQAHGLSATALHERALANYTFELDSPDE